MADRCREQGSAALFLLRAKEVCTWHNRNPRFVQTGYRPPLPAPVPASRPRRDVVSILATEYGGSGFCCCAFPHVPCFDCSRGPVLPRGYWTLCPGEVLQRFHTSICQGLSTCPMDRCEASNVLTVSLPDLAPALVNSARVLRFLRPAAFVMGAYVGFQLWKGRTRERYVLDAIGLSSAAFLGASSMMERFLLEFDRLRTHILTHERNLDGGDTVGEVLTTRQGVHRMVAHSCLIPGDIIHLAEGRVPADCRVVESCGLRIDSSFLPHRRMDKHGGHPVTAAPEKEDTSVLEANCVALATSFVTEGTATAVVTRTGDDTAVCLLASRLASYSPLQVLFTPWI